VLENDAGRRRCGNEEAVDEGVSLHCDYGHNEAQCERTCVHTPNTPLPFPKKKEEEGAV